MNILNDVILPAGRSAIELSLFVLLPVMIVMLTLMRLLEARGVLDWIVVRLTPVLRPVGLTGLGVFAALQITFVSFAAPVATLAMMEQRGTSDRHLAAAFALVLAMAQANTVFPMASMGLHLGSVLIFSVLGGLIASAAAYYLFGRGLSNEAPPEDEKLPHPAVEHSKGTLDVINRAGAEAFRITINALPMLVLSLVVVTGLVKAGLVAALTSALSPALTAVGIDPVIVLPTVTKYLAGGTAMMAVVEGMLHKGQMSTALLNSSAGFLIHPLDLPGIAFLASAGRRVASVWKPAVGGALIGIAVRSALHAALGWIAV